MNDSMINVHLSDKETQITDHLEKFPPTIIISNDAGIYVFASEIAKAHSNIVLAGAGNSFDSIADWFRKEVNKLIANWGRDAPDIAIEGKKLLKSVFENNVQYSKYVVYADIMGIELAVEKENDKIFRMNPWCKWKKYPVNQVIPVSYKNMPKRNEKKDKSGYAKNEIEKIIMEEKKEYGIDDCNDLSVPEKLKLFTDKYSEQKCFLNRNKLVKKEFNWIYKKI